MNSKTKDDLFDRGLLKNHNVEVNDSVYYKLICGGIQK
jgi:hypothetical protein